MEKTILIVGLVALLGSAFYLMNDTQVSATAQPIDAQVVDLYGDWKQQNGKKYASVDQDWYRLTVFNENYQMIKAFYEGPEQTYTLDFNQFMDITNEEFVQTYLGATIQPKKNVSSYIPTEPATNGDVDWRTKGVLNAVKNQASCGSCWAFSATGSLEPALALAGQGLNNLSEQELVDCSKAYGNAGCNGGWMDSAFDYVLDHGLSGTKDYAYVGRDQTCKVQKGTYHLKSYVDIADGDCASLESAVQGRPVSVAVDASNWQFYAGGVFKNCASNLNHGVTLVGVSASEWVVRNSWSAGWGESGYIRLAKGDTCGLCDAASYPVV